VEVFNYKKTCHKKNTIVKIEKLNKIMNTNIVLKKIMALLSTDDKKEDEEALTYARLTDGTILESPTFDVGQPVEVVSEDGTKTPAPDGEHELELKDSEGNETRLKIITKDGVIVERENVELEEEVGEEAVEDMVAGLIDALTPDAVSSEEAADIAEKVLEALEDKIEILKKREKLETVEVKPIPQAGSKNKEDEVPTAEGSVTSGTKLSRKTKLADVEVEPLPEDTDAPEMELGEVVEKLAYRIDELEKKIQEMEAIEEEVDPDEENELPKLDGAPVESLAFTKLSQVKKTDKVANTQSRFLQNLYK
jgi:hypothetical protein